MWHVSCVCVRMRLLEGMCGKKKRWRDDTHTHTHVFQDEEERKKSRDFCSTRMHSTKSSVGWLALCPIYRVCVLLHLRTVCGRPSSVQSRFICSICSTHSDALGLLKTVLGANLSVRIHFDISHTPKYVYIHTIHTYKYIHISIFEFICISVRISRRAFVILFIGIVHANMYDTLLLLPYIYTPLHAYINSMQATNIYICYIFCREVNPPGVCRIFYALAFFRAHQPAPYRGQDVHFASSIRYGFLSQSARQSAERKTVLAR